MLCDKEDLTSYEHSLFANGWLYKHRKNERPSDVNTYKELQRIWLNLRYRIYFIYGIRIFTLFYFQIKFEDGEPYFSKRGHGFGFALNDFISKMYAAAF